MFFCPWSQCFISHNLESESCLRSLEKPKPYFSTRCGRWNLCGRLFFFCISKHGTFFAAHQACKEQKIILFRSTPQSWYSSCLGQENVYFSLFTCQEGTELKKKSWQSTGHPSPETKSHAPAQPVNITQPHREVITFWELSRLCIIILWGGLLPCMNNTVMQW